VNIEKVKQTDSLKESRSGLVKLDSVLLGEFVMDTTVI